MELEREHMHKYISWPHWFGLLFTTAKNGYLASGSADKTIKVLKLDSDECSKTLQYHTDWVHALEFRMDLHI